MEKGAVPPRDQEIEKGEKEKKRAEKSAKAAVKEASAAAKQARGISKKERDTANEARDAEKHRKRVSGAIAELPAELVRLRTLGKPMRPLDDRPLLTKLRMNSILREFEASKVVCDGMTFFAPNLEGGGDEFLERLITMRSWPVRTIASLMSR